jgi:hypothetical protein
MKYELILPLERIKEKPFDNEKIKKIAIERKDGVSHLMSMRQYKKNGIVNPKKV